MPSEQKLHPATLLFDIVGHIKRFAIPALFVLLGMSQSTGGPGGMFRGVPRGWEVWLLVLFVPATLASIARYLSFRLRYEEKELVIRSGLIFRNERHIPFSRIQNIDAIQNFFHRLLGVVEVRVETGSGSEEEARLSVLPTSALADLRARVLGTSEHPAPGAPAAPGAPGAPGAPVLLHLPPKELALLGLLDNKGMVLVAAAFGAAWESGIVNRFMGVFFANNSVTRSLYRELARPFTEGGPFPFAQVAVFVGGFAALLLAVRLLSMIWAITRLHDFRLTRVGEDLRSEYGLFTRVAATIPIRRVQAITINAGPLYRLFKRATVRVATAGGGAGKGNDSAASAREWLAPLIHQDALPRLLGHVLPGFNLDATDWRPIHPHAFARAIKPPLIFTAVVSLLAGVAIGWLAIGLAVLMLLWFAVSTRQHVAHLGWAQDDEVVLMRSGWLFRRITIARVNKIQAVAMHQSPFDRRAAMARVRVDTAGAGEFSHRVDIPYLDHDLAAQLTTRLAAAAANTTFRW